ncbi:predicted protein [Botrytis cinerea T4]|uniref:Uncharacterized protein n=1 Tax=Botryotinia fuckeliana (strain T4) TaxID=999810 RepID=G2YAD5_BOTF4|nr:predicted protein [Botrytis cinerea T4]
MAGGEGGDDSFSDSVEISDELSAAHGINSFVDVGGNFGFSGLFERRKIDSATILGGVEFEECGESFDGFGVDDGLSRQEDLALPRSIQPLHAQKFLVIKQPDMIIPNSTFTIVKIYEQK